MEELCGSLSACQPERVGSTMSHHGKDRINSACLCNLSLRLNYYDKQK